MTEKKLKDKNSLKAISYKLKAGDGFTLIELLTAVAVIGIVSAFVLTNLNTGKKQKDIQRAAQKLMLDIRKAQNLALAPSDTPICIYGVRMFGEGYFLYKDADCDGGYSYNYPFGATVSTVIDDREYLFGNGIFLANLPPPTQEAQDIAFGPPEPITYMGGSSSTSLTILTLSRRDCPECVSRSVRINRFGQVEIQ